jgi:hypothetical protein
LAKTEEQGTGIEHRHLDGDIYSAFDLTGDGAVSTWRDSLKLMGGCLYQLGYPGRNSINSTSATNLAASSLRYEATTLNTASLKPPMFRMSSRSGACVDP